MRAQKCVVERCCLLGLALVFGCGSSGGAGAKAVGSGGQDGSGGSAGSGPPHIVIPCMKGGDELERGKWDSITPPQIDLATSGTLAFTVDPNDSRNIFVGSNKRGIYKSRDCGANWEHLDLGQNGPEIDKGANNHLLIDSTNTQVIYTTAGYGGPAGILKSTDGGVNWTQILSQAVQDTFYAGGFIESVAMEPGHPNHIVATTHGTCSGQYSPGCVAETTDSGANWTLKGGAPTWVETQNFEMIDDKLWLIGQIFGDDGIWRTGDAGVTWSKKGSKTGTAFYHAANGAIYAAGPGGVQKSVDKGLTWTAVANSPNCSVITGDGTNIYVGYFTAGKPYYSASEADDTTWTQLDTPMNSGPCLPTFVYDKGQKVLYSTNCANGLWRGTIP